MAPPYMARVGAFQPVEHAIEIARDMKPALTCLVVVRNPREQCSEACLKKAQRSCQELGVDLVTVVGIFLCLFLAHITVQH